MAAVASERRIGRRGRREAEEAEGDGGERRAAHGSSTSFISKHSYHSFSTPSDVCCSRSVSVFVALRYVMCTRVWLSTDTS